MDDDDNYNDDKKRDDNNVDDDDNANIETENKSSSDIRNITAHDDENGQIANKKCNLALNKVLSKIVAGRSRFPLPGVCSLMWGWMIFDEKTKSSHVEGTPLCNKYTCLNQPGKADIVGPAPSWLVEKIIVITMKLILMADMAVLFVLISHTSRLTIITITINIIMVWSRHHHNHNQYDRGVKQAHLQDACAQGDQAQDLEAAAAFCKRFKQSWEVLDRFHESLALEVQAGRACLA